MITSNMKTMLPCSNGMRYFCKATKLLTFYILICFFLKSQISSSIVRFDWEESEAVSKYQKSSRQMEVRNEWNNNRGDRFVDSILDGTPVYISMTTIASRLKIAIKTIEYIVKGSYLPTEVYIFVSKEPYIKHEYSEPDVSQGAVHLYRLLFLFVCLFVCLFV